MTARRHPKLFIGIRRLMETASPADLRRAGGMLERINHLTAKATYLGQPAQHDHSGPGSGGTLSSANDSELLSWIALMEAD